jgi:ABC-type branched-subunit amino acid transport system substrate-binding protein
MTIATFESPNVAFPQVKVAVNAAVDAINAAGGIHGRPIDAEFCDDKLDPNEAAACARRADEHHVVAVVGGVSPHAAAMFPILTDAHIPWIGGSGTSGPIELTEPISYPIQGGTPAMLIGVGRALVTRGGTRFAIVGTDDTGSAAARAAVQQGLGIEGGAAEEFLVPLDTVDFSGIVATALADDPDAIAIMTPPVQAPRVLQALRAAGYDGLIGSSNTVFPQATIDALGDDAEGLILGFRMVPTANTDNPAIAEFLTAMRSKQADVRIDELGLNAWTAVHMLQSVLVQLSTIDSASVMDHLDHLTAPIELGTVPSYCSAKAPQTFPRACNFVAILGRVENGAIVQEGDFFDPLA